jgi:hypothetical protein
LLQPTGPRGCFPELDASTRGPAVALHVAPGTSDTTPKVLNGASELVNSVFGERGRHPRMIYTMTEVVLDSACLIVVWAEVE